LALEYKSSSVGSRGLGLGGSFFLIICLGGGNGAFIATFLGGGPYSSSSLFSSGSGSGGGLGLALALGAGAGSGAGSGSLTGSAFFLVSSIRFTASSRFFSLSIFLCFSHSALRL
jgi:hypothetical protein